MTPSLGTLPLEPYRRELVAAPVAALLATAPAISGTAYVVAIDPALADTQALNEAFAIDPDAGANCVIVMGRRGNEQRPAACVVLSSTRADVNGLVRRTLDARKCSFAPRTGRSARPAWSTAASRRSASRRTGPSWSIVP